MCQGVLFKGSFGETLRAFALDFAHPFRDLNVFALVLETDEEPYPCYDDQWKGSFVEGTQGLLKFRTELEEVFRCYRNRSGECGQRKTIRNGDGSTNLPD